MNDDWAVLATCLKTDLGGSILCFAHSYSSLWYEKPKQRKITTLLYISAFPFFDAGNNLRYFFCQQRYLVQVYASSLQSFVRTQNLNMLSLGTLRSHFALSFEVLEDKILEKLSIFSVYWPLWPKWALPHPITITIWDLSRRQKFVEFTLWQKINISEVSHRDPWIK